MWTKASMIVRWLLSKKFPMANAGGLPTAPLVPEPEEREYLGGRSAGPCGAINLGAVPDHPAPKAFRARLSRSS